jgi:hypothetical protein
MEVLSMEEKTRILLTPLAAAESAVETEEVEDIAAIIASIKEKYAEFFAAASAAFPSQAAPAELDVTDDEIVAPVLDFAPEIVGSNVALSNPEPLAEPISMTASTEEIVDSIIRDVFAPEPEIAVVPEMVAELDVAEPEIVASAEPLPEIIAVDLEPAPKSASDILLDFFADFKKLVAEYTDIVIAQKAARKKPNAEPLAVAE